MVYRLIWTIDNGLWTEDLNMNDFLLSIKRPGRYIGKEWNVVKKDFDTAEIKFALSFPDLYEVGMSNLGLRIIYYLLNKIPDVVCERFFACDQDLETVLRSKQKKLFSLESRKNFQDFDMVGFSLGYELSYTNVLNMLDLGGIPLQAALRDENFPLVIGGGPCVTNPEPLHEFFDLFVIGEAEEVIVEIIDKYRQLKPLFKSAEMTKQDLLFELAQIEGVYVPSLYKVSYDPSGKILSFQPVKQGVPEIVRKRFIKDLDKAVFPVEWLVPYVQIIHDRVSLEIMRGCPNRCRFCQARVQYYPFRQRKAENVLDLADKIYKNTGYEEIGFTGLSVSDYYAIELILESLISKFKEKGVSISLPSIKPKIILEHLSRLIATIKKTGLTFAPEAASARLRKLLGKDFDTDDFFRVIEQAYSAGYQHVKLYFMIGLPFETEQDLSGITEFARNVSELRRKSAKFSGQVNISINTLIPKPHTAFQWFRMHSLDEIKIKQDHIRSGIKSRKLRVDFHNRQMGFLEGVFSRGDRRLSQVIYSAYKKGARFDSWDEHFLFDTWIESFKESGIDPEFYLRERDKNELLPWDFLDMGVSKESLLLEKEKIVIE